ncbi:ComEA family DNA-binding protein [Phytopseudomonas dryadis]|uniref:Competence protein ComEA n=1 Tax=Phytopseudomonas dryadis TaxID=2487520 RepID=A0A4Q9R4J7_9GAMM|nr:MULTISPECIES: helix-hairpin-helix domain-containing protein [Pseudomonas]TBU95411.1 competence protein ComEA [Pseudomonas dryadis]TBV08162.1 competence protein ComEA [Pseudomonas dryadis]TBV19836.1 competence protein ComEA [Pseudomonas sp. FRB 230]
MQKSYLQSLLFAALASASLLLSAAETSPAAAPEPAVAEQLAELAPLDLNTADAETLQRELSGVGAVKAQAIVSYRETHGQFASVDELLEVKGVGEALLERNRGKLTVAQ